MGEQLHEIAARQHGAFSRRQGLGYYTPDEIRARLRDGRWIRVLRGVYRESSVDPTPALLVAAAGLSVGRAVIAVSHTAAVLHGFGYAADGCAHVAVPGRLAVPCRPGLRVHVPQLAPFDVMELDGLLVTTPARTAVDTARACRRPLALATLDGAVHLGLVGPGDLAGEAHRQAGARGIVAVRELLPWVDGRAESPMESWTRWILLHAGLPRPELQFPVSRGRYQLPYRLDLAWPTARVAVEYDGVDWHSGPEALERDRSRRNWLDDLGWAVVYATAREVMRQPWQLVDRVSRRLALPRVSH